MAEGWRRSESRSESDVHIDPYFFWAEATQFLYLFGTERREKRFPVFIRLRDSFTARQFAERNWQPEEMRDQWMEWLRIPDIYASPPLGLEESRFCTASVTQEFFRELRKRDSL
jgi:hypothetical protein